MIRVPLTLMQERMWWLQTSAQIASFYNQPIRHRLRFAADPALVLDVLTQLVQRHESLRTSFPSVDGQPYQSINPSIEVDFAVTDLGQLPAEEREGELRRLEAIDILAPFDVARGPVFRAHLFSLGNDESEICLVLDHLVSDATSDAILVSEFEEVYAARVAGEKPASDRGPLDYADFAVWQRRWMTQERLSEHDDYWTRALRGVVPQQRLPYSAESMASDPPDELDLASPPAMYAFAVPTKVCQSLRRLTGSSGFALCAAAVAALVARATGEPDVLMVTSVGGRDRAELDGIVGLFGGFSVLRIDLSGDPAFEVALRRARAGVLGLLDHQQLPFSQMFDALSDAGIAVSLADLPVAVHYYHAAHHRWVPGTSVIACPRHVEGPVQVKLPEASKPLEFRFFDDGTDLWADLLYDTDYYELATVVQVVSDLKSMLAAVAVDPLLRLSQLPFSSPPGGTA